MHFFSTDRACATAAKAYSPYSGFKVGCVAYFEDGATAYAGTNVENASYGLTICAERSAIFAGVAAGCRRLTALTLACLNADDEPISCFYPCGACLQVIAEFATPQTRILLHGVGEFNLRDLLPTPFLLKQSGAQQP
jgi:cytidine deaminase